MACVGPNRTDGSKRTLIRPVTRVTGICCEKRVFLALRNFIGNKPAVSSSHAPHVPIPLHMLRHNHSAPVWLFSFVDLAFLLLIAFTQIGPEADASDLVIGQIDVPQIKSAAAPLTANEAWASWQLRVHPLARNDQEGESRAPFELIEPGVATAPGATEKPPITIDATELAAHLQLLRSRQLGKPVLAPHRDSLSEDLLIAVGLLEDVWIGDRSVTVIPGHSVASSPAIGDLERQ